MIYVPDVENYECFVVVNSETIRAYETTPTFDSTVNYRDYYITSNYLYEDGSQEFGRYTTLPVCLDSTVVTSDFWYRNDLDSILLIFLILSIFIIYLPLKIVFRIFRRIAI